MGESYGVQTEITRETPTMLRVIRICRKCGAKIFSDAPEGLCASCMLKIALGTFPEAAVAGVVDPGSPDELSPPNANPPPANKTTTHVAGMLGELGDYELLEEVGRGGQGVVFRARQKSLNRTVALKVISLGQWARKAHVKLFRLEAEAAARLEHPGIVPIHEVGERDGSCYFSMKFVEGGQLDEVIRRTPMPIRQAAELIAKVARTVHYAHDHGILHRDIKPGNILLDAKGEPHLTDFGLARLVESESTVTRTMEVLGTPSYMAPEQAVGNNDAVSSATDVYGIGAVLYQLLTCHPPFAGGTTYETIKLLLDTEPRQPRLLNPKIDRDLNIICLKCLEKDPKRRYPSALALAEDLERWAKHEPIQARRAGVFTRGKKWVQRNPAIAALVASLVALAATIGWNIWKSDLFRSAPEKSIAVLPFDNLSRDPDNAYFSDGIQDEILTKLAGIGDLKVISRKSTAKYKSTPEDLKTVARELGVATVLEGSVQKAGDKVRVNVQLLDARIDTHLWAKSYDRELKDVFAVESEVAQEIADTLRVKLSQSQSIAISTVPTRDAEAYDLFLKGEYEERQAESTENVEFFDDAETFYRQALARDPSFALAYARLAYSRLNRHWFSNRLTSAQLDEVKSDIERALAIAPESPEAHLALGIFHYWGHRDYDSALRALDRAIELQPSNSDGRTYRAAIYRRRGEWRRSLAEFERALELNPRDTSIPTEIGNAYLNLRRWSEAERALTRALALDPH